MKTLVLGDIELPQSSIVEVTTMTNLGQALLVVTTNFGCTLLMDMPSESECELVKGRIINFLDKDDLVKKKISIDKKSRDVIEVSYDTTGEYTQ